MQYTASLWLLVCALPLLPSCSTTNQNAASSKTAPVKSASVSVSQSSQTQGLASIYLDKRTASGSRYSATAMAAAHKQFPLGSKVRVTNERNGKSCVVLINDRGPYVKGRVIDLTPAAAGAIGLGWRQGLTKVKLEKL